MTTVERVAGWMAGADAEDANAARAMAVELDAILAEGGTPPEETAQRGARLADGIRRVVETSAMRPALQVEPWWRGVYGALRLSVNYQPMA